MHQLNLKIKYTHISTVRAQVNVALATRNQSESFHYTRTCHADYITLVMSRKQQVT